MIICHLFIRFRAAKIQLTFILKGWKGKGDFEDDVKQNQVKIQKSKFSKSKAHRKILDLSLATLINLAALKTRAKTSEVVVEEITAINCNGLEIGLHIHQSHSFVTLDQFERRAPDMLEWGKSKRGETK